MRCGKGGQSGMRGWRGGRWGVGCWRRGGWAAAVGVVHGLRGDCESTAPGKEDGAARRAQFDYTSGARTNGEPAAWTEAVLTVGSLKLCRVIGCVP